MPLDIQDIGLGTVGEETLLGAQTVQSLSVRVEANSAALGDGYRMTGQPVMREQHTHLRLKFTSGGSTVTYQITTDQFFNIDRAERGDDLSATGKGLTVTHPTAGTIIVGRSTTNRILLQVGTYSTSTLLSIEAEGLLFRGGHLESRLSVLEAHITRRIAAKKIVASATALTDVDVPQGVIVENGVAIWGTDDWRDISEEITAGNNQRVVLAEASVSYSTFDGVWTIGAWTIHEADSSFDLWYTRIGDDTALENPPSDASNYNVNIRNSDGTISTFLVGLPETPVSNPSGRELLISHNFQAGGTNPLRLSLRTGRTVWTEASFFTIAWAPFDDDITDGSLFMPINLKTVVIPCEYVRAANRGVGGTYDRVQHHTWHVMVAEQIQAIARGNSTLSFTTNEHRQYLQINFLLLAETTHDVSRADTVEIHRAYTTRGGNLQIWLHH